jgi:hypothetical protein
MSSLKGRKGEYSPLLGHPSGPRLFKLNFEVTASKLECFINPKTNRPRNKKTMKLK